jgi:hypothetical protein
MFGKVGIGREGYHESLPFARARPPGIVAPCHARAACGQVAESAAEEHQTAKYAQDIENGEARGGDFGLVLHGFFEVGFCLLAAGIGVAGRSCRTGLAVPGCRRHCRGFGGWN